ncbi:uncharacterized protein LOC115330374 [Ixodes scapularis]|uniref:uncharacterized protein LOC115330374 n=1 Tax=Ixodes scapularis TaxID=6945 RepID=UPI001A9D9EFD|nr:uncharacterized protein LOC115330374 [Ixodes scapularis]
MYDTLYLPASEAHTKFRNLRTYFFKEMSKIENSRASGKGTGDLYKSRWEFFEDMPFLQGSHTPRRGFSTLDRPSTSGASHHLQGNMPGPVSADNASDESEEDVILTEPDPPVPQLKRGKKQKRQGTSTQEAVLEKALSLLNQPVNSLFEDEDFLYSASLTRELKQLPTLDRDFLKIQLMQMVLQAKHNVVMHTSVADVMELVP